MGVRCLLEGGVRKSGRRLRITAQLVEAESGAHLWADKLTPSSKTFSTCRTASPRGVVGIVEPTVQKSEIERSRRKR
jgi:adenylate cyclase